MISLIYSSRTSLHDNDEFNLEMPYEACAVMPYLLLRLDENTSTFSNPKSHSLIMPQMHQNTRKKCKLPVNSN